MAAWRSSVNIATFVRPFRPLMNIGCPQFLFLQILHEHPCIYKVFCSYLGTTNICMPTHSLFTHITVSVAQIP